MDAAQRARMSTADVDQIQSAVRAPLLGCALFDPVACAEDVLFEAGRQGFEELIESRLFRHHVLKGVCRFAHVSPAGQVGPPCDGARCEYSRLLVHHADHLG